jgi:hypothetical protein
MVIIGGRVVVNVNAAILIAGIVVVVNAAVIVISAVSKLAATVAIRMFDIAAATALGEYAGMVGTFHLNAAIAA